MKSPQRINRRSFIRQTAVVAGAVSAAGALLPRKSFTKLPATDILNCAIIGCGGRSVTHLENVIGKHKQRLVAIVDPDERRHAATREWLKSHDVEAEKLQVFTDYRRMFDQIPSQIDAVFVATPNHHHALVSSLALQAGKNVYCEKPLCRDIAEARALAGLAKNHKNVATQMGSQGHCDEGYRRLCEFVQAGVIGNITETHSWTDRANGGVGPRPPSMAPPKEMHWDEWIGPAPFRDFHTDLHPHEWHGWYDFGNGSIGNMGCHVLDGVYWALKAGHPASVEVEYLRGGSDERFPLGSRIRWDIPAREGMAPVKAYWYEGLNQTTTSQPSGALHAAVGDARNLPALLHELQVKYPDEQIDTKDGGTLYVGEKGVIYSGTYGERMHVLPIEKMSEIKPPPVSLPRPKDVFTDFIEACRAGRTDTAVSFEYGAKLTEFAILGNLAQHAGEGKKLEWNGAAMEVTNHREFNKWVKREDRQGWRV